MPDTDPELDALRERYSRNRSWAKRGSYQTTLSPGLEQEFRGWLYKNQIPYDTSWPPDQAMQDYDMRGFWKAMRANDPKAVRDPDTGHFPDAWKTPYHETFSDQSLYAAPGAPAWKDGRLIDKAGNVIWDGAARLDPQDDPDAGTRPKRIPPADTPEEMAEMVRSDLDPRRGTQQTMGGMRPVTSDVVDYTGKRRNRINQILSPEEEDYWERYAYGLINPNMTGAGLMKEAQRVAPMPEAYPGVPSPTSDYTSWFLDPESWNYRMGRQGYGR